eukprot:scaffold71680_cov21-Tisochrysis_lutea.AAC.1
MNPSSTAALTNDGRVGKGWEDMEVGAQTLQAYLPMSEHSKCFAVVLHKHSQDSYAGYLNLCPSSLTKGCPGQKLCTIDALT